MKKFLLLFVLLLTLISACQHKEDADIKSHVIDETMLEEGDLLVRRGTSVSSRAVQYGDKQTSYSHIGIAVKRDSSWYVVHCVPGEEYDTGGEELIKCDPLSTFFRKDRAVVGAVFRYDTCIEIRQQVAIKALNLAKQHILFDRQYNDADSRKMYCTEMVNYLYQLEGIDLSEGRRHEVPGFRYPLIYPSDILNNQNLSVIVSFKKNQKK